MQFMQGNWPAGRLQHLQHFNEKVRMQCCLLCSVESVAKLVGWGSVPLGCINCWVKKLNKHRSHLSMPRKVHLLAMTQRLVPIGRVTSIP